MPTYEYQCPKCEKSFEAVRKISDPPLEECETEGCDGKPTRLISRGSFVLKGGGWAKDGY